MLTHNRRRSGAALGAQPAWRPDALFGRRAGRARPFGEANFASRRRVQSSERRSAAPVARIFPRSGHAFDTSREQYLKLGGWGRF